MNLDDGADIDAARRLVEDDEIRLLRQRLAMTTFCWLPPDSSTTLPLGLMARIFNREIQSSPVFCISWLDRMNRPPGNFDNRPR